MQSPSLLKNDDQVYRIRPFSEFEWLEHGFGTRHSPSWVDPNRLVMLRQIHSHRVVSTNGCAGYIGEGDALISNRPGMLVGVRTADCVPILLADVRTHSVCAVHAGWRGSADKIVCHALEEMNASYGTEPAAIYAAIGPCIRDCCYEVGPDVAQRFTEWRPDLGGASSAVKIDLAGINRVQLERAGVPGLQIYDAGLCTRCSAEFHSYRRDGARSGRMISAIGIR